MPDQTDPPLTLVVYFGSPTGQKFVGIGGKFTSEFPEACTWYSLKDKGLQRHLRSLRARGFVPTVIENYGMENERIALR